MRFTLSLFLLLTSLLPVTSSIAHPHNRSTVDGIQVGDILINNNHQQWYTVHVVALEKERGDKAESKNNPNTTVHAIIYKTSANRPALSMIVPNNITNPHAQMDIDSFQYWHKLTNKKPTKQDFAGYIHYLKHAHFERYVHFTGQNKKQIIKKSMRLDDKANKEKQRGHHDKAINLYKSAIALYPANAQAMEHLASVYMDNDLYDEALVLFESSLQIHPNNSTGQLLLGQCLLHMKRFYQAKRVFQDGLNLYPEQKALFAHYHQCALEEQNNHHHASDISF